MAEVIYGQADIARALRVTRSAIWIRVHIGSLPPPDFTRAGTGTPFWRRATLVDFGIDKKELPE